MTAGSRVRGRTAPLALLTLLFLAPAALGHAGPPPVQPDPEPLPGPLTGTPLKPGGLPPLHMPPPPLPTQPGAAPPPVVNTPTLGPKRRIGTTTPSVDYEAWDYWWAFRRGRYDDVKRIEERATTGRSVFDLGAGGNNAGQAKAIRRAIETKIVPVLMLVARGDATQAEPLTVAATIALGKVASKPAHIEMMLRTLDAKTGLRRDVRAGAALALGTLRPSCRG